MTFGTVFTKNYPAPPYDKREIFRYASVKSESAEMSAVLEECLAEIEGRFAFRVCYAFYPLKRERETLDLGFTKTSSKDVNKVLSQADSIAVFASTVGLEIDRLIARYGQLSPVKALFFQAIGAERIEALCEAFIADLQMQTKGAGMRLTPRFSPGYGDFGLQIQADIFKTLQPQKRIGLTLLDSLLMSPSKSVTAIVGIGGACEKSKEAACEKCSKVNCEYRK